MSSIVLLNKEEINEVAGSQIDMQPEASMLQDGMNRLASSIEYFADSLKEASNEIKWSLITTGAILGGSTVCSLVIIYMIVGRCCRRRV